MPFSPHGLIIFTCLCVPSSANVICTITSLSFWESPETTLSCTFSSLSNIFKRDRAAYSSLCSSIIFLSIFASSLEIFLPPKNAAINPGREHVEGSFYKIRGFICLHLFLGNQHRNSCILIGNVSFLTHLAYHRIGCRLLPAQLLLTQLHKLPGIYRRIVPYHTHKTVITVT